MISKWKKLVGLLNASNAQINPATEDKQDSILTELQLKANLTETQPVSAASLPLPAGAATAAKQDTLISNQTNNTQNAYLVDSSGNPINTTQKLDGTYALDVYNSDVKDQLINQSLIQLTGVSTTISTTQSAGDTQITVVDGSSFSVGDDIIIKESNELLDNHFKITAKPSTHVFTLDMPIDIGLTSVAVVSQILDSMNVSGSLASPQIFILAPPADEVWHITRLLFTMTDQTAMDTSLFGGLAALTNGLVIRKLVNGVYSTHANFKYNSKFADSMYDIEYDSKAPAGFYGLRGRWTIGKSGSIIKLDGSTGDQLQALVQDDLTGLDSLHWTGQGHKS